MCTVTLLPLKDNGFILTSNRDEKIFREPALFPELFQSKTGAVLYPKDPQAGGTWVACSPTRIVCLLNGAFVAHKHQPPYAFSRGKVVKDVFEYESVTDFFENYQLEGVEPFTLIIADTQEGCFELKRDETQTYIKKIDNKPQIWSSATLYNEDIKKEREKWFKNWLVQNSSEDFNMFSIKKFHETAGKGDLENGLIINRNQQMMTVSITSVLISPAGATMVYDDLLDGLSVIKGIAS